jgi:transcriptional regulator with XRE-family HTH domain
VNIKGGKRLSLSEKLKNLRKNSKKTLKEVGQAVGLSSVYISDLENGKKENPSVEVLNKFASYYDVSVDFLLGRTDERSPVDKIKSFLFSEPELKDFWDKLSKREDLQLLFKQTKDLSPEAVRKIIRIIKAIEEEEQERYNGR